MIIGEGSSITSQTIILTHDYSIDYGMIAAGLERTHEFKAVKSVKIGKNTFIGQRSIILPGVEIGDNCVIGAGSIVSKNIPSNSVCAGVPAKVIANTDEWGRKKFETEKQCIM
ncbi:MAG: acyltransferase [Ruminococcus sp.]|nr:acyltransferase [Ruminococcus sp.]